jgi:zinc protease
MNSRKLAAVIVCSFVTLWAGVALAWQKPEEIPVTSGNKSTKAWLIEDNTLPIISLQITFRQAGYAYEPDEKRGLSSITTQILSEGAGNGENKLNGTEFSQALDELGTSISFSANEDNFSINFKCLSQNLDESWRLLNLAIKEPLLDEVSLKRVVEQSKVAIKESEQDPDSVAYKQLLKKLYPKHEYSRTSLDTPELLENVKALDIRDYLKRNLALDNAVISVAGDITSVKTKAIMESLFNGLPAESTPYRTLQKVEVAQTPSVILTRREIPQSVIYFAQSGIDRNDPQYLTAYTVNHMLGGGGFTSRLMEKVRSEKALSYGISSSFDNSVHSAVHLGYYSTKNETANKSIAVVREEISKAAEGNFTEEELLEAKSYLTGSFPLNLDSNGKVVAYLATMQLYNLGADYLEKRNKMINNITLNEANQLAKRAFKPQNLVFSVVGNPEGELK